MDIDHEQYCGAEGDQIEMMMSMMKHPDFYDAYNDVIQQLPPSTNHHHPFSTSTDHHHGPINAMPHYNIHNNNNDINPHVGNFINNNLPSKWRGGGNRESSMAAMREMIFRIAAMQPINIDPESVKPPKRRNVKISKDPQSIAARHRREKISERIRILQRLVPGGTKMDTASMLDEAIHYVKFLKSQVQSLERVAATSTNTTTGMGFPVAMTSGSSSTTYLPIGRSVAANYHHHHYGDA